MGIREYSVSGVPVPSGFDMEISEEFQRPPGCRFLCHDCNHCRKASGRRRGELGVIKVEDVAEEAGTSIMVMGGEGGEDIEGGRGGD
jgi:hypothetical protein